jgi:murein DD-endopeptidase MepM/ murein hydrolase activator NlpD
METSEEISHPSFRRTFRFQETLAVEKPQLSEVVRPRLARAIARVFALFSSVAWRATSDLSRTGFARVVSHVTILVMVLGVLWITSYADNATTAAAGYSQGSALDRNVLLTQATAQAIRPFDNLNLYAYAGGPLIVPQSSIVRQADPFTFIPDRPRRGIEEYQVQTGDVLFGIANRFGVTPESILWNNEEVLNNDPHQILPGAILRIPPVSGVIHSVVEGDTLESIAEKYKVSVSAITVDGAQWNSGALLAGKFPQVGSTLIVPGGRREFKGWGLPTVNTTSVGGARPALGTCGNVSGGLAGSGSFIWPSNNHWISGYNFSAWHPGLDIAGRSGDPVYAADSGFVIYAGWSNVGYGNLVVIDHGNGWQTWYAHLSLILVSCGQDVFQGGTIGSIGSTGHSSGPHLHFEMRNQGAFSNPWNILPPS